MGDESYFKVALEKQRQSFNWAAEARKASSVKKIKAKDFEVSDANAAMARFRSVLDKLVRAPKDEIKAKRKRAKAVANGKHSSVSLPESLR